MGRLIASQRKLFGLLELDTADKIGVRPILAVLDRRERDGEGDES